MTRLLLAAVTAEAVALAALTRYVRRLQVDVDCEELHGLVLDGKVSALEQHQHRTRTP